MNTKKVFFGICTCLILMVAACTPNTADDQVYENGVNKKDIDNVHKNDIDGVNKNDIDRA